MKITHMNEMHGGWITGNFEPSVLKWGKGEIAIKKFIRNYVENSYYHEYAFMVYLVISGEVDFNGLNCKKNTVVSFDKGECISIKALENSLVMLVVYGDPKFIRGKDLSLNCLEKSYASFIDNNRQNAHNKIDSNEISVVIQGAVDPYITNLTIDSVRKHLPDSTIILSTWKNSCLTGLDYDKLVLSDDPGAPLSILKNTGGKRYTNNTNRQLVSIQSGLRKVTTKYTLKLRSDMVLLSNSFLDYYFEFPHHTNEYRIFNKKLIISDIFTRRRFVYKLGNPTHSMFALFHASDWFYFGLTEDVLSYFYDTPLMADEDMVYDFSRCRVQKQINEFASWTCRYFPEQYYSISAVRRKYPEIEFNDWTDWNDTNIAQSDKFITNNFIILDFSRHGITMPKYEPTITSNSQGKYLLPGLYKYGLFEKYYEDVIIKRKKEFDWNYAVRDPFQF